MTTSLFPVHRPSVGVSLRSCALRVVTCRHVPFAKPAIARAVERTLPPGTMKTSPGAPAIQDMEAVIRELRDAVGTKKDRAVALSLPDDVATIGLFGLDALPPDRKEREALLKWRLHQDARSTARAERLVYRLFQGERMVYALVAAVEQSVLDQYAALCGAVGRLPVSVGFETLQLFDAFRAAMTDHEEYFFVHMNGESLTLLAVRDGCPLFIRKRRMTAQAERIRDEVIGTLQYFDDHLPRPRTMQQAASPLFFLSTVEEGPDEERPFAERTVLTVPGGQPPRQIVVVPLGWQALSSVHRPDNLSATFLPAASCIGIT